MSRHWSRHVVAALIWGLVPLVQVGPVQASSPAPVAAPAASATPESAALRKFRDSGPPVMAAAAQFEAAAHPHAAASPTVVRTSLVASVSNARLYREVFGFAFASSLGDPTIGYPSWNFGLLSTVAYFGVHVDWTGDFSSDSGLNIWNDPNGAVPGFIETAHANGTKVVLTIEMFDSTNGTPNMCSALQRGALTIQRTVAQVNARGIDGVNVDYESNNTTCTEPGTGVVASSQSLFTTFVKNLRAALPASYISVDTYSGAAGYRDSSGAYLGFFDIGALANYADSFFVMAYDMEYANWDSPPLSCPNFCIGPTAPLSTYLFNDSRASSEYRAVVPASKVIMGIPYYGRKECVGGYTPSTAPPNAVGSTAAAADGYLDASTENGYFANSDYQMHRETRDPASATRWDTFTSSTAQCTREMYWDDVTALGNKYNLIISDHLRGAGIFALNYGGGAPELWSLINLKFGQCSEAAIAADRTIPQIPGTSVTFTGTALCAGTGTFRFWMQRPGGAFAVVQDYSTASTLSWDTTNQPLGTYTFQVDAKNQGASPPAGFDTQARTTFRLALCVTPTMTTDVAAPRLPGTAVTVTSTVTCQGTPEYRYWILPPGGTWTMVRDYSSSATFKWDTTHLGYGDYNIGVHVRTTGTAVAYESVQSTPYSLTSCIAAALTTDKTSPQPTGTPVVLGGTATCDGTPQYRFTIQPPGGTWSVVQDFTSSAAFTWAGGNPGGTYNLELDAKSAAAPVSSLASAQGAYVRTICSAVTLASSPPTPQRPGPTVVLTGSATCPGTAQYRFWIHKPDGSVGVVQDYGPGNTYNWNTTGLPVGVYGLRVDARNVGATTSTYEAVALAYYTVADPACTTPSVSLDPPLPQGTRTTVTFTASTTTCPRPLFEFWLLPPGTGSTWILGQAYSSNPTFHWDTTGAPAGDYQVSAWVSDVFSGSSISTDRGSYDAFANIADTLTSTPCSQVTASASPPTTATAGSLVIITASATCSHPNPLYEFWMLAAGSSSWQLIQPYSTTATYNWNSTGAAAGTEHFGVWVRDSSSSGTAGGYDTLVNIPYSVTTGLCSSVTESAAPPSSSQSGTQVTFTATAAGCANPRYEFWARWQGYSTWQLLQGYSTSNVYHWNSTGAAAGTEYIGVWVKDVISSAAVDAYTSVPYSVTVPSCASVTLSASPASATHGTGAQVTFTAVAAGCTDPSPLYEFWMLAAGSNTWQLIQSYTTSATYVWNTNGAPAGAEKFGVWVRDANSTASSDALVSIPYSLS